MPVTVVVGGQYGSEGKGKLTAHLALQGAAAVVRCGSINSGHTVVQDGRIWRLRLIPAGFVNPNALLLLPAGALVDVDILRQEMIDTDVPKERIVVDRNAVILEPGDAEAESAAGLFARVGSTQSGVGAGVARRVLRLGDVRLAYSSPALRDLVTVGDVSGIVNHMLDSGDRVIIEGTQGFGLSLYHSPFYPFATARDTTAAGFISEVGVSPVKVEQIVMAIRTFPIRVAGNSGPLQDETSWEEVRRFSGSQEDLREFTTTTNRLRRVGRFDIGIVRRAAMMNRPTSIALHGADYLSNGNKWATGFEELDRATKDLVRLIETETQTPVALVGIGPETDAFLAKPRAVEDPSSRPTGAVWRTRSGG